MNLRKLNTREEFEAYVEETRRNGAAQKRQIYVCCGSVCLSEGAMKIYNKFQGQLEALNIPVEVSMDMHLEEKGTDLKKTGCPGFCNHGPLVRIDPEGWVYTKVRPDDVDEIIQKSVIEGKYIERLGYDDGFDIIKRKKDVEFYQNQTRRVLRNVGEIDAEQITEAVENGGYSALVKVLFDLSGEEVLDIIDAAGLRGRSGSGLPSATKWRQFAANEHPKKRMLVSDGKTAVGSFMDRSIVEGDPHKLVEGMAIIALSCGVSEAYAYIRPEYPVAIFRLKKAVEQAEQLGLLGDNILGSGKSFRLYVNEGMAEREGAKAKQAIPAKQVERMQMYHMYISDDGTAKYPFSLNTIETVVNVPDIIYHGAEWFRQCGTEQSPGTKVFMLAGAVNTNGMIEIPLGMTVREVVEKIGGGMENNRPFRAMRLGGGNTLLLRENLDMPLTYENLEEIGETFGSGAMDILDGKSSMMEMAKYLTGIAMRGSCGKCTPCREGMPRVKVLLNKIARGDGDKEDYNELRDLAHLIQTSALCFETCTDVAWFTIDKDKCIGCTKCARNCPVGAIKGSLKQPHEIDNNVCIKCGACARGCPKKAVKENNPWLRNT